MKIALNIQNCFWLGLVFVLSGSITLLSAGAEKLEESIIPLPSDVAFLQGVWVGHDEEGSYVEENWSAPEGDSMMGSCRFVKAGKASFYELLTIVRTPGGLVLRMRHFNPELVPWDEKKEAGDCFLTSLSKNKELVFENKLEDHVAITYRKQGADKLLAIVDVSKNGKPPQHFSFIYKRKMK